MEKFSLFESKLAKISLVIIVGLSLMLFAIRAPALIQRLISRTKTDPTKCRTDIDCALAVNTSRCCACPSSYLRKQVAENDDLVIYEPGKDYSPLLPDKCKNVQCSPCAPATKAVCIDGDCRSELDDGSIFPPPPTGSSTGIDLPVSEWTSYVNANYNFSIQYPSGWEFEEFDSGHPSQVLKRETIKGLAFNSPSWTPEQPEGYQLLVLPEGEFDHGLEGYVKTRKVEIGGEVAERWDTKDGEIPGFSSIVFFQNLHDFRIEFLSTRGVEESKIILEKILSTFNFGGTTEENCSRLEKLDPEKLSQVSEAECQKCGGEWDLLGKDSQVGCNPRTSDAEKTCTDSDQCVGRCLGKKDNTASGTCSVYKFVLGCNLEFSKGKLLILCID